jgi:hypothetical protein
MRAAFALLLFVLAAPVVRAVTVQAPDVALTGTFTATTTASASITELRLFIDDAKVLVRHNLTAPATISYGVTDGVHAWRIEADVAGVTETASGVVSAQNLMPAIQVAVQTAVAEAVSASTESERISELALHAALAAANESRNASLAAQAIHVPSNVATRTDFAGLATQVDLKASSESAANQVQEAADKLLQAQAELKSQFAAAQQSMTILVVLTCLAVALALFSVVRVRRVAAFDEDDRILLRAVALHFGLDAKSPALAQARASVGAKPLKRSPGRPRKGSLDLSGEVKTRARRHTG